MIRKAAVKDASGIAETNVLSWQDTYKGIVPDDFLSGLSIPVREERWSETIASGKSSTFVAEEGGRIIGFADFGPCRQGDKDAKSTGELYAIYVRPEAKGAGVGSKLFQKVVEWLRDQGFSDLVTLTLEENKGARDFYRRMGMREDGTRIPDTIGGRQLIEVRYVMKLA